MTTAAPTPIKPGELNIIFLGLVGPLLPGLVAAAFVFLKWATPIYGAGLGFLVAAIVLAFLLPRLKLGDEDRKLIKSGLDVLWNVWAFCTAGSLLITAGSGAPKLEAWLSSLGPAGITAVFVVIAGTAAGRIAIAATEWAQAVKAKRKLLRDRKNANAGA
jgi:hypothetical protein